MLLQEQKWNGVQFGQIPHWASVPGPGLAYFFKLSLKMDPLWEMSHVFTFFWNIPQADFQNCHGFIIFSIMGTLFRNRLKFMWAQIFNIWDSKDEQLMQFDYIWQHSTLLNTIRHYFDTIKHYWNTIWTLLDIIRQHSDTIRILLGPKRT